MEESKKRNLMLVQPNCASLEDVSLAVESLLKKASITSMVDFRRRMIVGVSLARGLSIGVEGVKV